MGKTTTLIAIISTLIKENGSNKILVMAHTNEVCSHLVSALAKEGVTGLVWDAASTYSARNPANSEYMVDNMVRLSKNQTKVSKNEMEAERMRILEEAAVIVCTPDMSRRGAAKYILLTLLY